jgi:uncharacterized damage-inducible protein DinB
MAINQSFLGEFDHEMTNTRKTLERVPDGRFDWKPHTKSMSMGKLAGHIAQIPLWAKMTIETPQLDVAPVGGPAVEQPELKTRAQVLDFFDKHVPEARAALAAASDQSMMSTWTLLSGGKTVFAMPRVAVLRGMIMNHLIHHRAQLGVYLRLNDIAVPATYGPSADEGSM